MRHGDRTWLLGVRKLVMAAACALQPPPVGPQWLDELAALRRVYCTHDLSWRPANAPGPSVVHGQERQMLAGIGRHWRKSGAGDGNRTHQIDRKSSSRRDRSIAYESPVIMRAI